METVHYIKLNIGRFKQNSLRHHYNTHQRSDLQSQICRPDVKKKVLIAWELKYNNNAPHNLNNLKKTKVFRKKKINNFHYSIPYIL